MNKLHTEGLKTVVTIIGVCVTLGLAVWLANLIKQGELMPNQPAQLEVFAFAIFGPLIAIVLTTLAMYALRSKRSRKKDS